MSPEDKARFDALEKANKDLMASVSTLTLKAALGELPADQKVYVSELKKADGTADDTAVTAFIKMSETDKAKALADAKAAKDRQSGDFSKALDEQIRTNPIVKELSTRLDTALGKLSEVEKGDQVAAFAKRATDIGLPAAHGEVMRKAFGGDKDAIKKHEEMLTALVKQGATSALFAEFGSSDHKPSGSAYEEIRQKAADLQKALANKGDTKSIQQCVSKVMNDPANAELVARNRTESLKKMGAIAA